MKNRNKFLFLIISWLLIIGILYTSGIFTSDPNKIRDIISGSPIKMQLLFILLSTFRVIFFIPQTVFILLGTLLFGPYVSCVLSIISLILSQSIMFILGNYFNKQLLGSDFINKHDTIVKSIKEYGYKILALGIVCPITPSDLITALAACINLDYKKSIAVIVFTDAPMIFLYGILGTTIEGTYFFNVLAILAITIISYYSFRIWNKISSSYS